MLERQRFIQRHGQLIFDFRFFVYKWPSIFLHGDIVETGKERPDTRDLEVEEEKEIEG